MLPFRSPLFQTPRKASHTDLPQRITSLGLSAGSGWASGSRSGVPIASPRSSPEPSPHISRSSTPTPVNKNKSINSLVDEYGAELDAQVERLAETQPSGDGAPDAPAASGDHLAPILAQTHLGPDAADAPDAPELVPAPEPVAVESVAAEVVEETHVSGSNTPATRSPVPREQPDHSLSPAPISLAPVVETGVTETDITSVQEVEADPVPDEEEGEDDFEPLVLSPVLEKRISVVDITAAPRPSFPSWSRRATASPRRQSSPAPAPLSSTRTAPIRPTALPQPTALPKPAPPPEHTPPPRPAPTMAANGAINGKPQRSKATVTHISQPSIPSAPVISPLNSLQLTTDPSPVSASPVSPRARLTPVSPLDPVSPWPPREVETDEDHPGRSILKSPQRTPTDLPSAKEVYGSLAVLLTYLAFATYLVWGTAPLGALDRIGWTWYPSREWAVIVPSWLMMGVLLTYFSYAGLTFFLTPGPGSRSVMVDQYSSIRPANANPDEPYYWRFADKTAVPQAVDLPLSVVNAVLYPRKCVAAKGTAESKPATVADPLAKREGEV